MLNQVPSRSNSTFNILHSTFRLPSLLLHRDDVIEAQLDRAGVRQEPYELRAVSGKDVGHRAGLPLRDAFEVELPPDALPVHGRRLALVVIVPRDRPIVRFSHTPYHPSHLPCPRP